MLSIYLVLIIGCFTFSTKSSLFNPCSRPPNFPSTIPLDLIDYENWDAELKVKNIWSAVPSSAEDVVTLANWAKNNNYKLRASGSKHCFAPFIVTGDTAPCSKFIIVNTKPKLNGIKIEGATNLVTAQTGVTLDKLLEFTEQNGYGFYNAPGIGEITVGGMLAIDAHGTSIPSTGETLPSGHDYGTLSNKIVNLTAVVWDQGANKYVLKSFHRTDPESGAFLVHLGRAFVTEVTLMAGEDYNMRCQSIINVKDSELFGLSPSGNTVSSFLDQTGRLEIIWFAFTSTPWIMLRSVSPTKPVGSKEVTTPYNFPLFNTYPKALSTLIASITNGAGNLAPLFGQTTFTLMKTDLALRNSFDLWGKSKNLILYLKPTTVIFDMSANVIQTRRNNVQNVVNKIATFYNDTVNRYASNGKYPSNFYIHFRFTSLDTAPNADWSVAGISASRPLKPDTPFDVAIWFNISPLPNSPSWYEFMTEMETFLFQNFNDENAKTTLEWSKEYAFTSAGPQTNFTILQDIIPNTLRSGWKSTVDTLNKYDPNHVFSNSFLDSFLVA